MFYDPNRYRSWSPQITRSNKQNRDKRVATHVLCHLFVKNAKNDHKTLFRNFPEIFGPGHQRSGQVTSPPKNLTIASRPQWLRERFDTFRIWYTTKYLQLVDLGFFYIGDLRSGQFRDLPIISQWEKTQMPQILIRSVQIVHNHAQLGYC